LSMASPGVSQNIRDAHYSRETDDEVCSDQQLSNRYKLISYPKIHGGSSASESEPQHLEVQATWTLTDERLADEFDGR
jgi:hypothetical protein